MLYKCFTFRIAKHPLYSLMTFPTITITVQGVVVRRSYVLFSQRAGYTRSEPSSVHMSAPRIEGTGSAFFG